MPKIIYGETPKFHKKTLAIIHAADRMCNEYIQRGYGLTLRGLFYQFVTKNLIKNTFREYKRFGDIIAHGRDAGLIDWNGIIDRTRKLEARPHWLDTVHMLESIKDQFNVDMWENQPNYIEVWIEKDALIGAIDAVCRRYDVPFLACKGFASQSELWRAGKRFAAAEAAGQKCEILYLGDHDPSGLVMTDDVKRRARLYGGTHHIAVRRLALNIEQVRKYNPPPNFVKLGDSRAGGYVDQFGHDSWELDALSPEIIAELVGDAIREYIDADQWADDETRQENGRDRLGDVAAREADEMKD